MGRVCFVLLSVLIAIPGAHSVDDHTPRVSFIQPRASVILTGPRGTVIPVQVRIVPRAENRSYAIQWCDGTSAKSLDGADDSAIQPVSPLQIRVYAGACLLRAVVRGEGGKQLAMAEMVLRVCGGQEECTQ